MPEDMVREVITHLSLRELVMLSQIDGWEDIAHEELGRRVSDGLEKFELPDEATKSMMRNTKSLMSGSIALYVCNPGPWTPGDIDFYCPVGQLDHVLSFFTIHGYEVVAEEAKPGSQVEQRQDDSEEETEDEEGAGHVQGGHTGTYSKHVIKSIATLRKNGEHGPKLNVIESILPCAEAPIFCFHSTVVMNAITWMGVVCYYPEWTRQL